MPHPFMKFRISRQKYEIINAVNGKYNTTFADRVNHPAAVSGSRRCVEYSRRSHRNQPMRSSRSTMCLRRCHCGRRRLRIEWFVSCCRILGILVLSCRT